VRFGNRRPFYGGEDVNCKGLQCSPDQENDVEQLVKRIVEQEMRTVIEEVTATVASLNGEIETLKRLIDREEAEDSGMSRSTLAPIFEDF
jgi:paraquat-inducible protein B